MSEYHAAIGLAELDGWDEKQAMLHRTARDFRLAAEKHGVPKSQLVTWPTVASCYAFFMAEHATQANATVERLAAAQIESRRWYGLGLHRHAAYHHAVRAGTFATTEQIGARLIGLPVHFGMASALVDRVCSVLLPR